MGTIRRFYFYGLSLISVEVVIWGMIYLLRTLASGKLLTGGSTLATGISLVVVGAPIFLLHWRTAQRQASSDPEERASRIRSIFLYAALFAVLLPALYAVMALIDRGLITNFGFESTRAWFGGGGLPMDNLIALAVNSIALVYFGLVLRGEWRFEATRDEALGNNLADARRLYRYLFVAIGLTMVVVGVYNILRYLLSVFGHTTEPLFPTLAGGFTTLVVGAPLWAYFWWTIQSLLAVPAERRSLLRLVALYLFSLTGVIGVLATAGGALTLLIRWLLGEPHTLALFLQENSNQIGAVVPLAVVWWYYGRILLQEMSAVPDAPRRDALRRLYNYLLSFIGLAVAFAGLVDGLHAGAQRLFGVTTIDTFRGAVSGGISALLVGLPLWIVCWRAMQAEVLRAGDAGEKARRSLVRRVYLYLVLFLLVIGVMGFFGRAVYQLLNALFTHTQQDFAAETIAMFLSLAVDGMLLVYHFRVLRQDGQVAQKALGNLQSAFPTLILKDENDLSGFTDRVVEWLSRLAPRLPVAVHPMERGAPDETMLGAKAILMPYGLAVEPPESLRLWLSEYTGRRILIPQQREGWYWLGLADKSTSDLSREAALAIRQMAEGESVRPSLPSNPWSIAGYIMGGLFGLLLLWVLLTSLVASLFR
ncbi:MAG TPA: DUF5671 domain-containing protein [Anaerolineaceae bacterium]